MSAVSRLAEIAVRPLSGNIGAEISGVNLSEPIADDTFAAIVNALHEACGVLVFRDQFLTPAALHDFAVRWGEPIVSGKTKGHTYDGLPDVHRVTNFGKAKSYTERWHVDWMWMQDPPPPAITILAAQELPDYGGDTMWANQYLAYDRLSPGMQKLLENLRAEFPGTAPDPVTGESKDVVAYHPLVRVHPETGRRALLAGHPGDSMSGIEGLTPEESRPILDFLYEHATQHDLIYRHHWRPGDVLMWDNRCTLHYAVHDYGDEAERTLARVTLWR
jgi:alpha-ketoglutarate-dependent taurine dioxygenase